MFSVSRHQLASSSVVDLRGCGHQGVKHQGFILGCESSAEAERIVEAPSKSAQCFHAFIFTNPNLNNTEPSLAAYPQPTQRLGTNVILKIGLMTHAS